MPSESDPSVEGAAAIPLDAVVVRDFCIPADAEMAAAVLRANQIPAWLKADDCAGMYPSLDFVQGVRLLVRSSDAGAAKALLAATPLSPIEPASVAAVASATKASSPRIKLALWQIFAGVVVGVLLCLLYQHTSRLGTHKFRYDTNGDGDPDEFLAYRDGRCVEQSFDRNSDGKPDVWYYYDEEKRKESQADDNFDGRIDATWRFTNGILAEAKLDTDFNGITDVTEFYKDEQIKQADWRPNGSPVVARRDFFRHGTLIEEWCDTDLDGRFDATNKFDAFRNKIETNTFKIHSVPTP